MHYLNLGYLKTKTLSQAIVNNSDKESAELENMYKKELSKTML